MKENLFIYLKHEQQLLTALIELAERQQLALVKFNAPEVEEISVYQEEISRQMKQSEDKRITLIANWLGISKSKAARMSLSELEKLFKEDDVEEIRKIRNIFRGLTAKLQNLNSINRFLTHRAMSSIKEILGVFTQGTNHVCNVKV
jgi:hypothetical protein